MGGEIVYELIGRNPLVHGMIIATILFYAYLAVFKPAFAKKCARDSIRTLKSLIVPIIAAIMIAGAVIVLLPSESLTAFLGEQAGIAAVFLGVSIGSVLPACPFVSLPIIAGVYAAGASLVAVMAMLFGSGLAFTCRVSCDLTFFKPKVAGVRIILSFFTALVAGFMVYFLM